MRNDSGLAPMHYNVVIRMDPTEEKTKGGIILPSTKTERDELATDEGTLVAVSPHAFTYAEWPQDVAPPKPGDRVLFAQYAGRLWKRGDVTYRLIKDDSIVAVVEDPDEAPKLDAAWFENAARRDQRAGLTMRDLRA